MLILIPEKQKSFCRAAQNREWSNSGRKIKPLLWQRAADRFRAPYPRHNQPLRDAVKFSKTRFNLFSKRFGRGLHKPNKEVSQVRLIMLPGRLGRPKSAESA